MNKLFILLLFFFYINDASAQVLRGDTIVLIAYWSPGEVYKYKLDKTKYEENNGEVTETASTTFIHFEIVSETDSNYVIKYFIDSIVNENIDPMAASFATELLKGLVYEIETDENGAVLEIRNWKELKQKIFDLWAISIKEEEMDSTKKAEMNKVLETMTDSKQKTENLLLKDIAILFANYGYFYDIRDTSEYEMLLPNPYGGDPFPQYGQMYFENGEDESTIILKETSYVDREAGKKAIIQVMKQLMPDDKEFQKSMKEVDFQIDDKITQEFNLSNGSLRRAGVERKIVSNDSQNKNVRIEKQVFELIDYKKSDQ